VTDEDEDEDDGDDDDGDEDGEDEEGQDAPASASVEPASDAPRSAPLTATITVTAHSAVEAKMCADTLRSVLDGTALQAAVDALPSRKEIKALVHKERAEREEILGANLSTEDRINALRQQGAGGGGSGKPRGSRGGRRGPPP
jgi:3-oxoacyl-ACP reductase-like protein